jgi:hypothetical protein
MPQSADAGDPHGLTKTPEAVAQGAVNYLNPSSEDVKEESVKSQDGLIMERWRKMAGLL